MVESKSQPRPQDLDRIFQALADPTRRAILRTLTHREQGITEVARPFRMSLAAVSKHVKVLERAKLVNRRKEGSFSFLALNPAAMKTADQWMEFYRQYWDGRLASLKRLMEEGDPK
jgi:DNA-binding transcriptional ArsR family regulator